LAPVGRDMEFMENEEQRRRGGPGAGAHGREGGFGDKKTA
jgi:hypothetical protein